MHRKYDIELSVLTEKSKENSLQYKKIEKMIKDIYKEYPKWEKFGNI